MLGFIFNRFRRRSYYVAFYFGNGSLSSAYIGDMPYNLKDTDIVHMQSLIQIDKATDNVVITFIYPL